MQTMMVMNDMNRRTEQSLIPVGNVSSRPPPPRPIRSIYSAAFVKMTGNRSQVMPAEFSDNHDDDDDAAENKLHANSSSTHPSRWGKISWALGLHKIRMPVLTRPRYSNQVSRKYLIDPRDPWVRGWDVMIVAALLFTALVTPFELAYLKPRLNGLFYINRVVDFFFFLDMCFQFNLMFYSEEDDFWVTDRARICTTYIRTWFVVDLVSIIPFEVIGMIMDSDDISKLKIVRIIKLLRLAKLLRVLRVGRIMPRLEEQISMSYKAIQLASFGVGVMIFAHWMACALYLCVTLETCTVHDYLNGQCINWVFYYNENGGNGQLLRMDEHGNFEQQTSSGDPLPTDDSGYIHGEPVPSLFPVYWSSFYWAITTMATIGYGDITPQTNGERVFVTIGMVLGASVYAYLVGNVCSIIANLGAGETKFRNEMDRLNQFMAGNSVPKSLKAQLRQFYRYRHSNVTILESIDIMRTLTPKLQAAVSRYTQAAWLQHTDLFESLPLEMVVELCISLRPECFVPGERIFKEQTSCDRLFVTERGLVWYQGRVYGRPSKGHLVRQSQNTATILKHPKRHWIGTLDMFSSEGFHRHDAYALTYCVMLSLQEEYLEQQLNFSPSVKALFRRKLVKSVLRESIVMYSRAMRLLTSSKEALVQCVKDPEAAIRNDYNWMLKYKFPELLDLVVFKLGSQHEIGWLVIVIKKAAVTIQAAFRGYKHRRNLQAALQYMMYINSRSAANNLDENCPPPKSMARLMTRSLAASQVTSLILRNENVDGDDGGKRNESPRPLHPVRPAEDESTAGPSSSASPPGRPKALKTLPSHAASPDYELTRKSIKALRMQIIAMHSQLKSELEEVKYMVRKAVLQTSNAT